MPRSDFKLEAKHIVLLAAIVAVLVAIGVLVYNTARPKTPAPITAHRLGCTDNGSLRVFGSRILYYDGNNLYCIAPTGAELWRFAIGADAWYDCDDSNIALWRGSSLYVLNANGESTYSESLGEPIQFARIGKQYVGAVIGDTTTPRLVVKDLTGAHMDEESEAYTGLILMDIGFYGSSGQYLWSLATDVYGTLANTVLNTYEVGKTSATRISLGANTPYEVVYDSGLLHVITTRKIRVFNDTHSEDTAAARLVYGWNHLSHLAGRRSMAYLFAPEPQTNSGSYRIEELRLINGSTDKRFSLPQPCVGATLHGSNLYAFAVDTLYMAPQTAMRVDAYDLPDEVNVTSLIGILGNGRAVVASNEDVYVLTIPQ